jgi:hypothetical protein
MSYDSTQDFLNDLDNLNELPHGKRGEWYTKVESRWLDGVFHRDHQDPNAIVALSRAASNEGGYPPVTDYDVSIEVTSTELRMNPMAAINLGHHLIAAGTTAMRDQAKHAWFLSGSGEPVDAIELTGAQNYAPAIDRQVAQ